MLYMNSLLAISLEQFDNLGFYDFLLNFYYKFDFPLNIVDILSTFNSVQNAQMPKKETLTSQNSQTREQLTIRLPWVFTITWSAF